MNEALEICGARNVFKDLDGVAPLHSAGKLGAIFLQFPKWVFPSNEARDAIVEAKERLADVPMAVEFCAASWFAQKSGAEARASRRASPGSGARSR